MEPGRPRQLGMAVAAAWVVIAAALAPAPASAASAPKTFSSMGPDGGGFVNVVSFDPWNSGVVVAGGDDSGIFRSTDSGRTWSASSAGIFGINQLQVAALAFSPSVPGEIYAGVGYQGTNGGLLVSMNDGLSWSLRSSVPEFSGSINKGVTGLPAAHPRSTGTLIQVDGPRGLLYVATFQDGVLRSSNDGADWTPLDSGLVGQHLRSLAVDPANPDVLFASTYGDGVWKTTTASAAGTFTKLASSPAVVEDLTFIGSDLYAVGPDGLSRSSDGGTTWTPLGVGQLPTGGTGPPTSTPTWFTVSGYQACGKTTVYVGGQFKGAASVMVSTDAGASWVGLSDAATAQVHPTEGDSTGPTWWLAGNQLAAFGGSGYVTSQIAVDPTFAPDGCNRKRILVSGRAGVYGTIDGGTNWYPMVRGLGVTVIRGTASDPNVAGRVYLAPADWGFISSTDGGASVSENAPPAVFDAFGVAIDASTTPSTVYLATGKFSGGAGEIWSSSDPASGTPWTNEGLGLADGGLRPVGLAVNQVAGSAVILATVQGSGIWRKAGGAWSLVNTSVTGGAPSSFSWLPGSSTVYLYDHSTGIWRSTDAGENWSEIWVQQSLDDMTGYVAADPRDASRLYVSVGAAGVFRLDGADVGTVQGGQLVPQQIGAFATPGAISAGPDGVLYVAQLPSAAHGPAILASTDSGVSWSTISDASYAATGGFPRALSAGLDGILWVGLNGNGMLLGKPAKPSYQPDGLLAHGSGSFVGNNVYSTNGAHETQSVRLRRGRSTTFRWRLQNDGALSDRIAFKGAGSSNGFSLGFSLGMSNVTKAVVAGTYTKSIAPGASITITVSIKVAKNAKIGAVRSELLNASSTIQPVKDKVLANVTVRR